MAFDLEQFERHTYGRRIAEASNDLFALLEELETHYGAFERGLKASAWKGASEEQFREHVVTRIANAISSLGTDPGFRLPADIQPSVLRLQRWSGVLFAGSPLRHTDHMLRQFGAAPVGGGFVFAAADLLKLFLFYTPDSEIELDLAALARAAPELAAGFGVALIAQRCFVSPAAHARRERLLGWLPGHLDSLGDLDVLPHAILHNVYMNCSYADRADKHAIKRSINRLIRRKLAESGVENRGAPARRPRSGKPVMLVVVEWFTADHSIYRTHSLTLESARRHFHIVGVSLPRYVDDVTKQVFDEHVELAPASTLDQVAAIRAIAEAKDAQVCYMPSVGMFSLTMWLANLRLAPIQLMSTGHPATTFSEAMDGIVLEEDFVGDPACFQERIIALPPDGMPYRPAPLLAEAAARPPQPGIRRPGAVNIAVCASLMKLNPRFLATCLEILRRSRARVFFHFLIGGAYGITSLQVAPVLRQFLGENFRMYPHQNYDRYFAVLQACDFSINPFPFGNTNGVIDVVAAGKLGVCKTGPEAHEHIDEALFRRLGFPDWTIAPDIDSYVRAAVRLANDADERAELERALTGPDKLAPLFAGRAEIFGDKLMAAWEAAQA